LLSVVISAMPSRGETSAGIHFIAKKTTLADFVSRLNFQFLVSQCRVAKKTTPSGFACHPSTGGELRQ
jgi:hypothetical protein